MNLVKLWVKGFASFKDYQEFIFQPNSLTLITGRNGSGKSTMFVEALSFLWYNKPHRDLNVSDWINEHCDYCEVGVSLDDGGDIIKTRDRKGKTEIIMYGEPATQEHLESFIGIDKDLFFNSYIFAQGFGGFVFLKDADKKKFIMKLSLGFLDKYLNGIYEVGVDFKAQIQELEEKIEKYQDERSQLNLSDLAEKFKQYEADIKQSLLYGNSVIKGWKTGLSNCNMSLVLKEKELRRSEDILAKLQDGIPGLSHEVINLQEGIATYAERIKSYNIQVKELKGQVNILTPYTECPWCFRKMDSITKKQVRDKVNLQIHKLETEVTKFQSKIRELSASQNTVNAKIQSIYKEQNGYIERCKVLRKEINGLKWNQADYMASIRNQESLNIKYSKEKNPYKELYEKTKKRNDFLYKEELVLSRELKRIRNYLSLGVNFWEEKFHLLKNTIFTKVLEGFGPLSNDYFNYISEGKYTMRFVTDLKVTQKSILDKFEIEVFKGDQKVGFNRLSPGEKRQLALANNIAFIQLLNLYVGSDSNFVIMDEIFDNLDTQAKDYVFLILDQLREKTGKSLLLITHDEFIIDHSFKVNQIKVVNDGETSYFKENKTYKQ